MLTPDAPEAPERAPLPELPPRLSVWRVYLFGVGSFGIYLPFWIFRAAGATRSRSTVVRLAWALGSVVPVVACALLYDFRRAARDAAAPHSALRRRPVFLPALLFLIFYILWGFSPLQHFALAPVFLIPISFALVQRAINRAALSHEVAYESSPAPGWAWAPGAVGLLAVGVVTAFLIPDFLQRLRPQQSPGSVVSSRSGLYDLHIPSEGWSTVSSGTLGDDESDLELIGPGLQTWTVAYAIDLAGTHLDQAVSDRRDLLFSAGTPLEYDESRFFLEGSDFVVASMARCLMDLGFGERATYLVLTTELEDHVIELVGSTLEPDAHLETLENLLLSITLRPVEKESEG